MATTGGTASGNASDASAVAATLADASFVHVVAHADGDSLAAAGVLARALRETDAAYQVSVARTEGDADRRAAAAEDTCVAVGTDAEAADAVVSAGSTPASVAAFDAARELGATPDAVLALAGAVATGVAPGADGTEGVLDAARDAGVERRPGVGIPTADLADGLAHSTLVHAEFSGDESAAGATLAELGLPVELDADAWRTLASLVAVTASAGGERAAESVERALRPHAVPDGPFATVEGYADVLDAVAREQPGTASALALGHDARAAALDAWRAHATAAHRAVRTADPERYRGFVVADVDASAWTVARLLRDFRSPEPNVLVAGERGVALACVDADARATLAAAVDADRVGGTRDRAFARVEYADDLRAEVSEAL